MLLGMHISIFMQGLQSFCLSKKCSSRDDTVSTPAVMSDEHGSQDVCHFNVSKMVASKHKKTTVHLHCIHLADAFIQRDVKESATEDQGSEVLQYFGGQGSIKT